MKATRRMKEESDLESILGTVPDFDTTMSSVLCSRATLFHSETRRLYEGRSSVLQQKEKEQDK